MTGLSTDELHATPGFILHWIRFTKWILLIESFVLSVTHFWSCICSILTGFSNRCVSPGSYQILFSKINLIFTLWCDCSICFRGWLEAFSSELVDSNIPLDPSTRDWISLNTAKHRPVFCYCSGSGAREITLEMQKGAFPLQKRTEDVIFYSESDFPCAREITLGFKKGRFPYRNVLRTSSLGLKWKQKHDLLLGVVYPFNKMCNHYQLLGFCPSNDSVAEEFVNWAWVEVCWGPSVGPYGVSGCL